MDDLVKFLRDRLDEDAEEAARGYLKAPEIPGYAGWDKSTTAALPPAVAKRVLAEVEAKRLAIDHYTELQRLAKGGVAIYRAAVGAVGVQIQIMAMPYAGHPEYQDAWRPEHLN